MASPDEEAARFVIVSVPFKNESAKNMKRVVGIYDSRAEARRARQTLVAGIPQRSGYIEDEDYYWVAYGEGPDNEVLLLIEPTSIHNMCAFQRCLCQ
jgi:hypothetical protein